jgi:hypothetical protein
MIHELKKREYEKVRPLFEELEWNLITSAVIKGTSPGRVYADRHEGPRTAFMCTVEGYYLAGYEDNDARIHDFPSSARPRLDCKTSPYRT